MRILSIVSGPICLSLQDTHVFSEIHLLVDSSCSFNCVVSVPLGSPIYLLFRLLLLQELHLVVPGIGLVCSSIFDDMLLCTLQK